MRSKKSHAGLTASTAASEGFPLLHFLLEIQLDGFALVSGRQLNLGVEMLTPSNSSPKPKRRKVWTPNVHHRLASYSCSSSPYSSSFAAASSSSLSSSSSLGPTRLSSLMRQEDTRHVRRFGGELQQMTHCCEHGPDTYSKSTSRNP